MHGAGGTLRATSRPLLSQVTTKMLIVDADVVEDGVGENDDTGDDDVSGNLLTVTTLEHQQAKETSPRELFSKSEDVHRGPGVLCLCIELQHDLGLLYASLC